MPSFSVAIIAGGKSSRMGTDKSFVSIGNKPIIQRLVERVSDVGQSHTLLITNRPADYAQLGLPMFGDVIPDKGALGGIHAAVSHSPTDYVLAIACDMPFVEPALLKYMTAQIDAQPPPNVIVPRVDGYPQGLHAVYSKACLPAIESRLNADHLKVIGFYPQVRVRYLDESEYEPITAGRPVFFNVNTPQQLEEARQLANML